MLALVKLVDDTKRGQAVLAENEARGIGTSLQSGTSNCRGFSSATNIRSPSYNTQS